MTNKYRIKVYLVKPEHERLYVKDIECDHYHIWNDDYEMNVEADSIPEALEVAAAALVNVPNWRSVDYDEEVAPRTFHCHSKENEEYENRLHEQYS